MAGAKFTIDADSSKAQTALLSFEKKTKAIAKSIAKGFTERIGHKLFDGLASAAAKVPQFLGNAIDSASSMNEELGKSEAVFGSSSKMINDWSKKTADAFGISRIEALQATGTMGNMLKAFDVTGEQASGMAKHLVELAADMGSFNEASVEDTLFAIGAALRGENEPIRKFGVALDDARMKQEALSLGLYSGKGALSANAKAMASYSLIVKQTEIQQGNFKETSDDLANSKKRLVAQFKDLTAEVGKSLLPVVKDLISRLQEVDFEDVAQKISKVIKVIIDLVPTIIGVGIAIQGIKMAMFFKTMVTGLISATSLWGAQTKIIDLNTAAKIRNATAGGGAGAAAAGAGGAAAGAAAGGVLSKIPQILAVLATAAIAFKGGEFIGKAIAGSMGSGGPTSIASDTPGEWDKKNEEEKNQKLKRDNDAYRGAAKNRKMEADAANAKINQDREDKANKTAKEKKKIIKSINGEYNETLRILDARIRGDKKLLEQEKLRKEIQEEQKASASQGFMLGEKPAKDIVMKRRAADEAEKKREKKREKDKVADLKKKEKFKSDLGEDISESESKLDSAMGRSSITAVSSMQSIGGGGGVAGQLNLQKTQTSLQRELVGLQQQMVVLLEGVKTGVSQEHI